MVTRSREDYQALIKSAEETLARPRPAEGSSWTTTPLPSKQPEEQLLTLRMLDEIWDTRIDHLLTKILAPAMGEVFNEKSALIRALEKRVEELEKQHEQE
jgi:hypothetical protein